MAMEVTGIKIAGQFVQPTLAAAQQTVHAPNKEVRAEQRNIAIEKSLAELSKVSHIFNRRLKFTINEELGEVVVKVIDGDTDKVIKELPPEEIQRLHIRIREAIGLLVDTKV